MKSSTRIALAALVTGLVIVGAQSASALSFSVPAGRIVVDLDLSTASGLTYDGTTETLSITTDVDALRLDDESTVSLLPGQLVFNVTVSLVGTVTSTPVGFDTIHQADLSNGAFDFTIVDTMNTASVLDDEMVLGGDFDGDVFLEITESLFFGTSGNFGGGSQGGVFDVTWLNAALTGKVPLEGDMSAILSVFSPTSFLADGGGGFVGFSAQPNIDFNFTEGTVPEPGVAWLLGTAVMGSWLLRRRRG